MAALLWGVIAAPGASEANRSPYQHVYGVFACVALCATELFPAFRDDPGISTRRICAALTTA